MPRQCHPYRSWSQYHDVGHSREQKSQWQSGAPTYVSSREYWAWFDTLSREMRDAINNASTGPDYRVLASAIHRDHPELWQKAKKCLGYR